MSLKSHDQVQSPDEKGAVDVSASLAEVGLSHRAAWLATAATYIFGGVAVHTLWLINPAGYPWMLWLGLIGYVYGTASIFAARHLSDTSWGPHLRLMTSIVIYIVGGILAGPRTPILALAPMLALPTACFMYGPRLAMPYAIAIVSLAFVYLYRLDTPVTDAHAIVAIITYMTMVTGMIFARSRTRILAMRNRQLAYQDPLTGIANARRLHERIEEELNRTRGADPGAATSGALFAIDLDDFKQVNDRFSHAAGDSVLKAVARAISDECKLVGFAARPVAATSSRC